MDSTSPLRAAFVLEQALGHVTHSQNLERVVAATDELTPSFLPIPFELRTGAAWIPGYRNWTVRAGIRAWRAIRREHRALGIDVLFIHTQVPAILAGRWMRRIPAVVSLDATPQQIDHMGTHYQHRTSSSLVEHWKFKVNQRCYRRARHLVTWSNWTREALVRDYGVAPERVSVIAPGVDFTQWEHVRPKAPERNSPVGILFVGGDFHRKGGPLLLEATRRLRMDPLLPNFEVHLVTGAEIPNEPGVVCHNGLTANSPRLIELYHQCEIFCLPTHADALGMVLAEAAASSMAMVSTNVGAIAEIVRNGETGVLIEPGSVDALAGALAQLVSNPALRRRLGDAAHDLAGREHNARVNAGRIVSLLIALGREEGHEATSL